MNGYGRVRRDIAEFFVVGNADLLTVDDWKKCLTKADQILAIEGIAILRDNQSLPRVYVPASADGILDTSFALGAKRQRDAFMEEGFRRVIGKEEK